MLYNASRGTIKHVLQRQKVIFRDRGGLEKHYPDALVQQMVADWHAGMSQKAVGAKHGLSEAIVYKILRAFPAGTYGRRLPGVPGIPIGKVDGALPMATLWFS